ncbi:unnamed protein product [Discosporangium mesarthrocarpum]
MYMPSPQGLEVKISTIPSAGMGLFTLESVGKGDVICEYTGDHLVTRDAIRKTNKSFLMRLGPQVYVDAMNHQEVLARYINDCRNSRFYNAKFEKIPEQKKALVVATRRIRGGEEIFADYGRWYWLSSEPVILMERS